MRWCSHLIRRVEDQEWACVGWKWVSSIYFTIICIIVNITSPGQCRGGSCQVKLIERHGTVENVAWCEMSPDYIEHAPFSEKKRLWWYVGRGWDGGPPVRPKTLSNSGGGRTSLPTMLDLLAVSRNAIYEDGQCKCENIQGSVFHSTWIQGRTALLCQSQHWHILPWRRSHV